MTASKNDSFDIAIIGSGPGGYVAAIRAGQLGMHCAVVEKAPLPGGTCLHWGCIPTKAMLHAAEVLDTARDAGSFGIRIAEATLDLPRMHAYKDKTVKANAKGVEYLFKKNKVTLLSGRGRLRGAGSIEITADGAAPRTIRARKTILATGSSIRPLPGTPFDGRRVIHSDHALQIDHVPQSLIVLGAGAVGVEFASIFRSFGSAVTVVELLPRLVPLEDAALGQELAAAFKKRGIGVHIDTRVEQVHVAPDAPVRVEATSKGQALKLEAEMLLVAIGRAPATDDIGLEGTGVRLTRGGHVEVDAMMRTGEPDVYAIGDILPTPALAHVAFHEGVVAVEHAAGKDPQPINYDRIPSCTYCQPEVASIGLSEEAARERGHDVRCGSFPFSAVGKAKILGQSRGFVKIVSEARYGEILGVHIIGPHATELISEATAALNLEATVESLFHAIHAHPTLSEAMGEAALAVHKRAIHI